jgi:hypothetical protein
MTVVVLEEKLGSVGAVPRKVQDVWLFVEQVPRELAAPWAFG